MTIRYKTKNEIVHSMCLTYRHDYGIIDPVKQEQLFGTMLQIYENDIEPILNDFKKELDRLRWSLEEKD